MKIAYLISVYKDPTQFKRMVRILDNGHTHFFIHVDAKVGQEAFTPLAKYFYILQIKILYTMGRIQPSKVSA